MRSCAVASAIGGGVLSCVLALGACRSPRPRAEVPPVTTASGIAAVPVISGPIADAGISTGDAGAHAAKEPPVTATFVEAPARLEDGLCQVTMLAVVDGKIAAAGEALGPGDVLVLRHAEGADVKGAGLFVQARTPIVACAVDDRPAQEKTVVRANAAPKLEWGAANARMSAHLDVGSKVSPSVYLGRLEGTAPVAEHAHDRSWEILAAVEAAGTFTLDGHERRLAGRQVIVVPPGTKHAWKPDPGSKLVAVQMYAPPGPEQRFVALAAAPGSAREAGVDAGADAGKR